MDEKNRNALNDEALDDVNGGFGLHFVKPEDLTDEQLLEEFRKALRGGNKLRKRKLEEQIRIRGLAARLNAENAAKAGKVTFTAKPL